MDLPEFNADLLLVALRNHIGHDRGITARGLVAEINGAAGGRICNERVLRKTIEALREQGHHICARPESGYFIAATPEELEATIEFLKSRAMASLKQVAAMKRVSIPDLVGQLHLPT